ncbi:MAG: retention module-containing protein, partial [Deltaproteobacteria bacterium]|nr:retention module-containing protein [Deltaproteobacteria bacterium]
MATIENTTGTDSGTQVVGRVAVIYGTVKAVSPDGTERILTVNSPIFADDTIVTEADGRVSIVMDNAAQTQIDIGRMSEVVIDEDIYAGEDAFEVTETAAQIEEIQEALLTEEFDPTAELEAPAAGGPAAAGGGMETPEFDRVTHEGEVTSGAETTGITTDTVDPITGVIIEQAEEPIHAVVSLSDGNVIEGNRISFTASVDIPPQEDLILTVDVEGTPYTVIIPDGATTAELIVQSRPDEFYIQGDEPVTATVTEASGGGYDTIDFSEATDTAIVSDDDDVTTVTLAAGDVNENAAGVIFTATLSNPGETDVTVHTNQGDISIPAGDTTGTLFVATADPDVYVDPDTISATVTGVDGGNYEAVDYSDAAATARITDTIDPVKVWIETADVKENAASVFTVKVDQALEDDLKVTLSNDAEVTVKAGDLSATYEVAAQGDDVYVDPGHVTLTIDSAEVEGKIFENLTIDPASATSEITDTENPVTATLSTTTTEIPETGGDIVYTIRLTGTPGDIDPKTTLVFHLANGEMIEINPGETEKTITETYSDEYINDQATIDNSIVGVYDEDGNPISDYAGYEKLITTGSTSVDVDYAPSMDDGTAESGDTY